MIKSVTGSTQDSIQLIQSEISAINAEIIDYENQSSATYKFNLVKQLNVKWQQLKDLKNIRPRVTQPTVDSPHMEELTAAITSINEQIAETTTEIEEKTTELAKLNIQLNQLERFEDSSSSIERSFNTLRSQYKPILSNMGLEFDDVTKLIILKTLIKFKREEINSHVHLLSGELD